MNVIRSELQPPRMQPELRPRQAFDIILAKRHLNHNVEPRSKRNCKWTSSSTSRNARGGGPFPVSSSLITSTSRNVASRSGTRTTTGGPGAGSSSRDSGGVILAVTTGRGDARCEVGIAAMDIHCPHIILCQISDSATYINTLSRLYLFDPIEVLMPDTMCDAAKSKNVLYRSITDNFPDMQVTAISRVHFNDTVGLDRVKTLCFPEYSAVELFVKQKYYALAAVAALLKYIEYVQRVVYAPKSMKIEFQGSPNSTIIDLESARSLELAQSQCGRQNVSLFNTLDRCSTPMGRKLLRANILQPPCEEDVILERQAAVAELVSNRSLRALIQPILRRLYGADRLLALSTTPAVSHDNSVQCAEQNLNYVLLLKHLLDAVPELRNVLSVAESSLLRKIQKKLGNEHFRLIQEKILGTIHPDARSVAGYTSSNMQRCFAIKAGINDLLDIARQTYCELIDDMKSMVGNLANKYNLALSLNCNASLGFHVQMVLPRNVNENNFALPAEFVEVRKSKRTYTMTTDALAALSQQCRIACDELHLMSNILLCDVVRNVREYIGCMFHLSADVAELDLVMSLASVSSEQTYVRPAFGQRLEVLESRHPMMDAFGLDTPVPNDINATIPRNVTIISGANMSGKSTYLKQIVLLHIMAQTGCFVPAKEATFRVTDAIFCKMATRDEIECNASTFMLEMKESQYILQSVTANSLIVLDEPCRGTAIEEGASIAWAICHKLLNTTAFVFVATHFFYLTKLADLYVNVTNRHIETRTNAIEQPEDRRLTYTHKLKHGAAPTDDYGVALAEFSGLPKPVIEKAGSHASGRTTVVDRARSSSDASAERDRYNALANLYELLESGQFRREQVNSLLEFLMDGKNDESNDKRDEENEEQEKRNARRDESEPDARKGGQSAKSAVYSRSALTEDEIVYRTNDSDHFVPSGRWFDAIQPVCVYSGSEEDVSKRSPMFPPITPDRSSHGSDETLINIQRFTPPSDISRIPSPLFTRESLSSQRLVGPPINLFSPASSNVNVPSPSFTQKSSQSSVSLWTMEGSESKLYEYCLSDIDFDPVDISDIDFEFTSDTSTRQVP